MPHATVNGQNIYYEDTGGSAPVVIFSHGLLMDGTMFAAQVAELRSLYRCITWDERAHGRSAGPHCEPFSYYDSADDLAALLQYLGIDHAVLAGMSQGGYLSLRCALTHPELVRALILMDTQALPENPKNLPGYAQMIEVWASQGLPDSIADMVAAIILGDGAEDADVWKGKWRQWLPANLLQAFHTLGTRDDISDRVGGLRQPALVVHGDRDLAIELARAQAMAAALPHSEMVVIPGGGHAANLTHAALVNPHIVRFLASLEDDPCDATASRGARRLESTL